MEPKRFSEKEIDDLLIRFVIGYCSDEESQRVNLWLSENAENQHYYDQLKDIYALGKTMRSPSGFDPEKSLQRVKLNYYRTRFSELNTGNMDIPAKKSDYRWYIGIAASIMLIVSVGFNFRSLLKPRILAYQDSSVYYNEISSPLGSRTQVSLPDGTLVWLNAGSRIKYPMDFMKNDRNVILTGEAFFEVKKHPGKRFIVNTSDLAIRVRGTKFNVKAYPDEATIQTTLVEGSISILNLKGSKKDKETYLTPNQTATYYKYQEKETAEQETAAERITSTDPIAVEIENEINTVLYTSWKDHKWFIEGQSLGELARELERRFNVVIRFDSESIKKYRFTGIIAEETFEQIMEIIKVSAPITYTIDNNQVILEHDRHSKTKYEEYLNR